LLVVLLLLRDVSGETSANLGEYGGSYLTAVHLSLNVHYMYTKGMEHGDLVMLPRPLWHRGLYRTAPAEEVYSVLR